jgi:hypothetical protein
MATTPGKIDLPKIQVDWWDTGKQSGRTAVLPQWEVVAQAGSGASGTAAQTPPARPDKSASAPPASTSSAPASGSGDGRAAQTPANLWLLVGGLILLAAVLTVLLARKARLRKSAAAEVGTANTGATQATGVATSAARERLHRACTENNPQAAAVALLELAKTTWRQHPPRSLGDLATRLDRGGALVRDLEAVLYAPGGHAWTGQPLWQAFREGFPHQARAATGKTNPAAGAPSLYPDWTQTAG